MSKPVNKESFWKQRLEQSNRIQDSVYVTSDMDWHLINRWHEDVLKPFFNKKVLDAGCGYGRWSEFFTDYIGVDLSPDFIDKAKELYTDKKFKVGKLESLPYKDNEFDLAFCVSVKVMIKNNLGEEVWNPIEAELKRVAKEVIFLEYSNPNEYEKINTK